MFVSLTLVKTICSSTRMSCLLPQFKCLPDTFSLNFNKSSHLHHSKCKETIYLRTQCVLSASQMTSTATTTVLDVDKLQLPSLEANTRTLPGERSWKLPISTNATAVLDLEQLRTPSLETHSSSESIDKQWMYTGTVGPPAETRPGRPSTKETLATSEEAVIAVTAAEAVALAKAALEVAKDAALRLNLSKPINADCNPAATSYLKNSVTERSGLGQLPEVEKLRELRSAEISLGGGTHDSHHSLSESGDIEPTQEDLELLQAEIEKSIAVRSRRQTERKAKRTRAAEKAAANVVSVKSGSTSRKKRSSSQDVDYSDPLRYFRGATSSSRLLTAAEEQQLSEGIQGLLKLERLQEELTQRGGVPPTHAQWAAAAGIDQKTLRERLNYGILCKDKMIKSNIRLVISIAKNFQGSGMNLQDLVQEGCRGLVRGAEKFDASKGFKFSTYAHWWIKQSVRKSLSDQSRTIRLPFHMVEATYRVKEARKQLFSENGRHPDDEEVAEATGLSMTRLSAVMLTPKAPRSLDQKIGVNQDLKPSEVISDPEAETSEEMLLKQFMRDDLDKILDTLNKREKQVIRWRFGLEDGRMKTLQEIGELMGVSRERIRQIESCAFRKLKNKKRTKHLQQYILS